MFSRPASALFSIVSVLVLAGAAFGVPADIEVRTVVNQCNTGPVHCCDSTFSSNSYTITSLFGGLGIPLPASNSLVGMSCSPNTVGGVGSGAACTQQPVCCTGNTFNGLFNIGCSPITINM